MFNVVLDVISHRHRHHLVPFLVEFDFFFNALVFVLVLDPGCNDRPQENSFVIRKVVARDVKTQESFTGGHGDNNEHDLFTLQAALCDVAMEQGGVSGQHGSNLNAELVDATAKIIV